jgi:hypothetical protein
MILLPLTTTRLVNGLRVADRSWIAFLRGALAPSVANKQTLRLWLLVMWAALIGLDWAGALWYRRAPFIVGYDRWCLSGGLLVLAVVAAAKSWSILVALRAAAGGLCPRCEEPVVRLNDAPGAFVVCVSCERAWGPGGQEIDWP